MKLSEYLDKKIKEMADPTILKESPSKIMLETRLEVLKEIKAALESGEIE